MKGLELSEKFYLEYGAVMLHNSFPHLEEIVAVGLCGSGSECFGYDDELSKDHDFEPGFCIFIPDEIIIDEKTAFELEKAYCALPKEFMGYKRNEIGAVGGKRHGVIRADKFFMEKTGSPDGELSLWDWFTVPEQGLAEATNGRVFRDDVGIFSDVRKKLRYFPEDVRLKKLAGNLLIMGQAGQYNYKRCISRGETGAAQLALYEFTKSTMNTVFLLNKKYMPYYKWSFRAMGELTCLGELKGQLEYLISSPNDEGCIEEKEKRIENICRSVTEVLRENNLTGYKGEELEGHAYAVNNKIADNNIRNLHILYGV